MKYIYIITALILSTLYLDAQITDKGYQVFNQSGGSFTFPIGTHDYLGGECKIPGWVELEFNPANVEYIVTVGSSNIEFKEDSLLLYFYNGGNITGIHLYKIVQTANVGPNSPGAISFDGGIVPADQYQVNINNSLSAGIPSGACDSYRPVYSWEYSTDNSNWHTIAHANQSSLTYHDLTKSAYFRRYVTYTGSTISMYTESLFINKETNTVDPAPGSKYKVTTKIATQGILSSGSLTTYNSLAKVSHYDANARNIQNISVNASGTGTDIISPILYGYNGVISKQYLPYSMQSANEVIGEYQTDALYSDGSGDQTEFYSNANLSGLSEASDFAYSETFFEESFRSRVLEQGGVGEYYQQGTDHTKFFEFRSNHADEVKYLVYNADQLFIVNGYWPEDELQVQVMTDEEQRMVATYTNSQGQLVMKKSWAVEQGTVTEEDETYYLYNSYGQIIMEIPDAAMEIDPTASALRSFSNPVTESVNLVIDGSNSVSLEPGFSCDADNGISFIASETVTESECGLTPDDKEKFITQYIYDNVEHRKIGVKHPGADWIYYVYDKIGRVVLTQDGNLRDNNQWAFVKYDKMGRKAYDGIYTPITPQTREELEAILETSSLYEIADESLSIGYTQAIFPSTSNGIIEVLNMVYYDDYSISSEITPLYAKQSNDFPGTNNPSVNGLVTCTATKVLNTSNEYGHTIFYYDDKYNAIQIESKYGVVEERKSVAYNFNHQPTYTYTAQTVYGSSVVEKWFTYNDQQKLQDIEISFNTQPAVKTVSYTYDALGRVKSEKLHVNALAQNGLQEVNYLRNLKGQLVAINDVNNLDDPNTVANDLFALKIDYDTQAEYLYNTPRYDGGISAITWVSDDTPNNSLKRGYTYEYDGFGRLESAAYKEGDLLNSIGTKYNMSVTGYNKNGNITGLTRVGDFGHIDNLTYTYDGNKLLSVDDASGNLLGFKDGADNSIEYTYNSNGNMLSDANKGITNTLYNILNLPDRIEFDGNRKIEYTYTASGLKLAKKATENGTVVSETHYFSGYEYDGNGYLTQIHHEKGRIRIGGGSAVFDYALKDHLGNVRVMFTEIPGTGCYAEEVQVNNYYPFGMRFNQGPTIQTEDNNYTYSGKELQEDFGLNWTDHHARFYDPALGRWHTQDPLYQYHSPYLAMGNNPVLLADYNGTTAGAGEYYGNWGGGIFNADATFDEWNAATSPSSFPAENLANKYDHYAAIAGHSSAFRDNKGNMHYTGTAAQAFWNSLRTPTPQDKLNRAINNFLRNGYTLTYTDPDEAGGNIALLFSKGSDFGILAYWTENGTQLHYLDTDVYEPIVVETYTIYGKDIEISNSGFIASVEEKDNMTYMYDLDGTLCQVVYDGSTYRGQDIIKAMVQNKVNSSNTMDNIRSIPFAQQQQEAYGGKYPGLGQSGGHADGMYQTIEFLYWMQENPDEVEKLQQDYYNLLIHIQKD